MLKLLRGSFARWPKRLTRNEMRRHNEYHHIRGIEKLQQEYADLIVKPHNVARLSEIISELGKLWNDKLRYEEENQLIRGNGRKSLRQVQESVHEIVCETGHKIDTAKGKERKHQTFAKGLYRMKSILDEWETRL